MMRSLYSAISGLNVNQQAMDVLGNNISNVNTIGYKAGRTIFQDMLSQTISAGTAATSSVGSTNPSQIGLGSVLATVSNIFTDGTNQTTDVNTDLAIQGDGFFMLRGNSTNDFLYTRAGDFNFDTSGNLVSSAGYAVQGWMTDPTTGELTTDTNTDDIVIGSSYQAVEAKATANTSVAGVLSTDATPNVLEYPTLLHYANASNSIYDVYSSGGVKMDLSENEPIKIKANATQITDMADVYNDSDVNLSVSDSPTMLVYINNTAYTFKYGTGTDSTSTKYFKSLGDLAQKLQNKLDEVSAAGDFNVSVQNGTLSVDRAVDSGTDVSIDSFSGSARMAVVLSDLTGSYNDLGDTKTSSTMQYENTVYTGRDFTSLNELASQIEASIDGNVLSAADFSVSFNESTGQFEYNVAGTSPYSLSGFTLDKAYSGNEFESNIVAAGSTTIAAGTTGYSDTFLREAKDTDTLKSLFTSSGQSLGLDDTAILQFTGSAGGSAISGNGSIPVVKVADDPTTPLVDETQYSTLQDLRTAMADYFGYSSSSETALSQHVGSFDDNAGKLVLTSNAGTPNSIDYVKFDVVGSGNYTNFYDYYDYSTTQAATGGKVVTSQTIYDAQGNEHTMQYNFELVDSSTNTWKLSLSTPDDGATVAFNESTDGSVYLHFNANGSFNYISTQGGNRISSLTANYDPGNGAGTVSDVAIDLGSAAQFDGVYLSSGAGGIEKTTQDGYPTGSLEEKLINTAGQIIGYYSNGQVTTLGQIALATFTNNQGLLKVGDTTFKPTTSSGDASIGTAGTGARGDIAAGALENSNVDLSKEFVGMITTERGFQANSRVITTSDEMLQELLNLKR